MSVDTCRRMSDGLFLDACSEVAKDFPDVKFDDVLLDRACLHVSTTGILELNANLFFLLN